MQRRPSSRRSRPANHKPTAGSSSNGSSTRRTSSPSRVARPADDVAPMEQRSRDSRRLLTLVAAVLFVGVSTAAVVIGARSQDDQKDDLGAGAVTASAPEDTILVSLMAPDDGCWLRTITDGLNVEDDVTEGCGSATFRVSVRKEIRISFERSPPASW